MIRHLRKPLSLLVIIGLVGCTSTRWTAISPQEGTDPIAHVRVTTFNGDKTELYRAVIVDSILFGTTERGRSFSVSMDEVRTIEVTEEGEFSGGKTASLSTTTAVLLVVGTAVFVIGVLALGTLDSFNQSW